MKDFNKSGFTLIEIIVVLIIIGILAAIALPNIFANAQKSRGSAALAVIDGFKSQVESCAFQNNIAPANGGPCDLSQWTSAAYNNDPTCPNRIQGFVYLYSNNPSTTPQGPTAGVMAPSVGTPSGGNLSYTIAAYDCTLAGFSGYYISVVRQTNGSFYCSAPTAGPYAGVC